MEEAGHLVRSPSKEDRRKIHIRLTEKDKALRKIYEEVSKEMIDLFYTGFTEKEIEEFEGSLKKILKNLLSLDQFFGN